MTTPSARFMLAPLTAVMVLSLGGAGDAAARASSRGCGNIRSAGAPVHVRVLRGSTSCPQARLVLREYLRSRRPCKGSSCLRIHRGYRCQTAPAFAFPRIASCVRGRSRIAAYSTAD